MLTGLVFVSHTFTESEPLTLSQIILPLGSTLSVVAIMMISLTQKDQLYQPFLSQGILLGVGVALMYASCSLPLRLY